MSRRIEIEKEIEIAQKQIDEASENIPEYVIMDWGKVISSLSFELNNLYDDVNKQPD